MSIKYFVLIVCLLAGMAKGQHFKPPDQNPYQPMTIYVIEATYNGRHMVSGDEIAVFNPDTLLVDSFVLEQQLAPAPDEYEILRAGLSDSNTVGFNEGDTLRFRFWDFSDQKETIIDYDDIEFLNANTGEPVDGIYRTEMSSIAIKIHHGGAHSHVSEAEQVNNDFRLDANVPNPFNPVTTLCYSLSRTGHVALNIFDLTGRHIRELVNDIQRNGTYSVQWDGTDEQGIPVASGMFFYRLSTDMYQETRKMSLIR
ncbi:MAG: FlgD immunoglobulin-like domain containing protein [candidate division KSB1 bacterium]|nr:FlgD immunoglobulin-like domain containing protein [candidate division KSB1 bacterium]